MKTSHKIIIGDSRRMQEIDDASVELVITSPPYWQLKDYGDDLQIGFNDTYEEYVNNLNLVWQECHRVLRDGCRLCVNIGDQFARSLYYGRYKVIPIRTEIIRFCETAGFDYMGAVIWQKTTTTNTTGGGSVMGSYPYPRNGVLKLDYEFILLFKKYGTPPPVTQEIRKRSKLTKKEWNQCFSGHWNFPGEKQNRHLAMFPEELPKRLIKMFSFAGDTVLDPFLGSGTTSLAARDLGRDSVGYEIKEEYLSTIKEKLGWAQMSIFNDHNIHFANQKRKKKHYKKEIEKLPYVFKDPVRIEKKVNPKNYRFGSKIDGSRPEKRETYYSVKEVVDPEVLILSGGRKIRLLGIRKISGKEEDAILFLKKKTKGQRVFLKSDPAYNNSGKDSASYLYLKNRTFLNAHLIKQGLADVETETEYRHKNRFLKYKKGG